VDQQFANKPVPGLVSCDVRWTRGVTRIVPPNGLGRKKATQDRKANAEGRKEAKKAAPIRASIIPDSRPGGLTGFQRYHAP
jgi:hypothetical protein